jgi:hypothetical protein
MYRRRQQVRTAEGGSCSVIDTHALFYEPTQSDCYSQISEWRNGVEYVDVILCVVGLVGLVL